jgi:hypothetical protein
MLRENSWVIVISWLIFIMNRIFKTVNKNLLYFEFLRILQIFLLLFRGLVPCQQPSYEGKRHISQSPGDTAKAYDVSTFGDAGDLSADAQRRLEQWQHGGE